MAAVLLIPFLSLRFGVLSMLDSSALRRAAHFPPFRAMVRLTSSGNISFTRRPSTRPVSPAASMS